MLGVRRGEEAREESTMRWSCKRNESGVHVLESSMFGDVGECESLHFRSSIRCDYSVEDMSCFLFCKKDGKEIRNSFL